MLDDNDLEAAVVEGIISAAQAEKLRTFVGSSRAVAERADDERFRFMRGFNDFFFAVGIVLLGAGMGFFTGTSPIKNLIAAAIIWGLAEFLVKRLRLVLPGILLVCLFWFFIFQMVEFDWAHVWQVIGLRPQLLSQFTIFGQLSPVAIVGKALIAGLAAAAFYARFRLPFALLVIAGSGVLLVTTLFGSILFPSAATFSSILLICGLAVFWAAMAYDLSDSKRVTRASDCAFWLHLLAAPLIVHSLIGLVVPKAGGLFGATAMTMTSAVAIFAIVAVLTAIAVLIDRRALLVSALTYLGVAIGYAITSAVRVGANDRPIIFFATLLILGALVLALGAGWQPLRRLFLRLFPASVVNRLPPVAYSA
jgi:hypothetical protein